MSLFPKSQFRSVFFAVLMAVVTALLSGCGKKAEDQTAAPNSQIVARVGNQVVSVQELDTEFRAANVPNDKRRDPAIVKRVLGELVTRKYLLQQALEAKLDREPSILLDLLRAREQVLANAVATRQVSTKSSALTKADIEKFIANNPAKFANQLLLSIEQISVPLNSNTQSAIEATKDMNSLDAIDKKLEEMGVPHNRSNGTLNSAEIPDDLLKKIESSGGDSVLFARAGQNGVFFKIKGREPHPVEGEAALALARQLIRIDMMKTEASIVSMSANLEAKYEGEFAKIMY